MTLQKKKVFSLKFTFNHSFICFLSVSTFSFLIETLKIVFKNLQRVWYRYTIIPTGIYMVNNRYTRTRCKIHSKLTIKTPEHTSHLVLLFLLSNLNM